MSGPLSKILGGGGFLSNGPVQKGLGALSGWLSNRVWFGGDVSGQISGQGTLNQLQSQQNAATASRIWGGTNAAPDTSVAPVGPENQPETRLDPVSVQDRRAGLLDKLSNRGNVSNFMVGGSPVIMGTGDPNGRYRKNRDMG